MKAESIRSLIGAACAAAALLVSGCASTAPIENIRDAPVAIRSGKPITANDVYKAIERAGQALGWQLTADGPGIFTGRLLLRSHAAVVTIQYDVKTYSILYRDSVNLDARDGLIHRAYNEWVDNLDRAIRAQLEML